MDLTKLTELTAISPIDGRYRDKVEQLSTYFNEYALIKNRLLLEVNWLIALTDPFIALTDPFGETSEETGVRETIGKELNFLLDVVLNFSLEDAVRVKEIERATNHDMKAVEYWLRERLLGTSLEDLIATIHAALTSEDVNSVAYALMIGDALQYVVGPAFDRLNNALGERTVQYADMPMLALTHGQPASPTTVGKEMNIFKSRFERQRKSLDNYRLPVKWSGTTGTHAALLAFCPEINPAKFCRKFIEDGIRFNLRPSGIQLECVSVTTQVEPHDGLAELFHIMIRINLILIDLSRDMWGYISRGVFVQKAIAGEVGSSTMPHKVNPIDFENAEGNLGVANALFSHFAEKLPISRFQRDLSDSTVMRNIGVAFAHSLLAYELLLNGLQKISPNEEVLRKELDAHWEVLMEPAQMILRREGVADAYEIVKKHSRGKGSMRRREYMDFVAYIAAELSLSPLVIKEISELSPHTYVGLAPELAKL